MNQIWPIVCIALGGVVVALLVFIVGLHTKLSDWKSWALAAEAAADELTRQKDELTRQKDQTSPA